MHLFTATGWTGTPHPCDEGELQWIKKAQLRALPMWEGDKIFLKLLEEDAPFFSLKLRYEGEHLAQPRRMVDVRAHFNLTLRDYDTIMVMARQMGLSTIKSRKTTSANKYTLNQNVEQRVMAEAERRGYTPNRALNVLLTDFFMLIDARHRAQKSKSSGAADIPVKTVKKKGARDGETGRKRRT